MELSTVRAPDGAITTNTQGLPAPQGMNPELSGLFEALIKKRLNQAIQAPSQANGPLVSRATGAGMSIPQPQPQGRDYSSLLGQAPVQARGLSQGSQAIPMYSYAGTSAEPGRSWAGSAPILPTYVGSVPAQGQYVDGVYMKGSGG